MGFEDIETARDGRIFTVTINRPEKHNAVSPRTNAEMAEAFDEFANDNSLWVAILTGAGDKAFCSGGDIGAMVDAETEADYPIPASGYGGLTNRHDCFKPIIAAVNGFAFGGGFEMVLAADLAIAAEGAKFGLPEPKIGTAAVAGGMHRLVRQLGWKPAMEILLTGDPISAEKALSLGLINNIVPRAQVLPEARKLADKIAACAPFAIQATKQSAMLGLEQHGIAAAMQAQTDGEYDILETMFRSADIKEGLQAFLEKRNPNFEGH